MWDYFLNKGETMSVLEAGMLVCFGASWPAQIYKTYKTKNVKGKSKLFMSLVILGYILGMLHKIFYDFDWVFYVYLLDALLVTTDFALFWCYRNN